MPSSSSLLGLFLAGVICSSNAFMTPSTLSPLRTRALVAPTQKCSASVNLRMTSEVESGADRRSFLAAALSVIAMPKSAVSETAADPVVVTGEMRLEVGSDKKLAAVGGKAVANVFLRIVGKGIISKTSVEIDLPDFPAPGQPKPGETGGVPFVVKASDLVAKTEKGITVTRELWEDDDIFVAVDVNSVKDGKEKRVLRGIGKAKMKPVDGVNTHQKPLVLLE